MSNYVTSKSRKSVSLIFASAMSASLALPPSQASAAATTPVGGFLSAAGIGVGLVGGGVSAGYGLSTGNGWFTGGGALGLLGGGALLLFDPPSATLYSGSFTVHYDPYFLSVYQTGWLGDWGLDPSLAAPPVDPTQWDGVNVVLQSPANGLIATVTNNPVAGLLSVDFNWPNGKLSSSSGPFNMFGAVFSIDQDMLVTNLGNFTTPPAGANLYVSSSGISCALGSASIQTCGEATTTYFRTGSVPEPSTWVLMLAGFGGLGLAGRRASRRTKSLAA